MRKITAHIISVSANEIKLVISNEKKPGIAQECGHLHTYLKRHSHFNHAWCLEIYNKALLSLAPEHEDDVISVLEDWLESRVPADTTSQCARAIYDEARGHCARHP